MSVIPQSFKDSIEMKWCHDHDSNVDILTVRFLATSKIACIYDETVKYKNLIEEHVVSELYKYVLGIVLNECEEKVNQ